MKPLDSLHDHIVLQRRVQRLAEHLSDFIPLNVSVLDVGSGDGKLASLLMRMRPDLSIQAMDVAVRTQTSIPIRQFDGETLPYPASSFDIVLFVDVLHHTVDPLVLLREAVRVARKSLILKDHVLEGRLAGTRLRFMDYVGNARHGVALPFNYWTAQQWQHAERLLSLTKARELRQLELYPWPADYIFGSRLHFIARYDVREPAPVIDSREKRLIPASEAAQRGSRDYIP
jgi:SAM-dependent methyltransferase